MFSNKHKNYMRRISMAIRAGDKFISLCLQYIRTELEKKTETARMA